MLVFGPISQLTGKDPSACAPVPDHADVEFPFREPSRFVGSATDHNLYYFNRPVDLRTDEAQPESWTMIWRTPLNQRV
jgi:hypothetical protein